MIKKKLSFYKKVSGKLTGYARMINSVDRVLPDFMIIGAAKGGTTSLFNYLTQHPQIIEPTKKEISYFSAYYQKGTNWYRHHFPTRKEMQGSEQLQLTGEATPYYLSHPFTPSRVHKLVPSVKLIVLLRNPVDRAWSNYQHMVRLGLENQSFEDAIKSEPARIEIEQKKMLLNENYYSSIHQRFSYLNRGIYHVELKRWFEFFPRESFLILNSEDFYNNPSKLYHDTLMFLGLNEWTPGGFEVYNKTKSHSIMSDETRKILIKYYEIHNKKLFELLETSYNWNI